MTSGRRLGDDTGLTIGFVVRVLAVSDEIDELSRAGAGAAGDAQLILACGDLPFDYLDHLMNALDVPLVFVPGNHDPEVSGYRVSRSGLILRDGLPARTPWPDGAVNADCAVVDVAGLRVAGLGGCRRYSSGPNQYSEWQQARRARALSRRAWWRRLRDGRGVDVLITHAPPRGVGDADDPPHQGFVALRGLVARLRPGVLLHGHVARCETSVAERQLGNTIVRNVVGSHLIEIEPGTSGVVGDLREGHRRAR